MAKSVVLLTALSASTAAEMTLQIQPTLQVVSNPLLDREFQLKNGTRIPNPIHGTAWRMLRDLGADHVRFQPWFPYPHKSVAELQPPKDGKPTSWNFTDMMPQFEDFMANTAEQGHSVTWNVGTIPCWMYWGPTTGGCPYPADPDKSDFGYGARGIRYFARDPSGNQLADYLARVMSYMVNGYMVDEHGVTHSGGPKWNLSASAGHAFEFLNEGEHYYTAKQYNNDYDVLVPKLQSALPKDMTPSFTGIGGCHDGHWNWWTMPDCTEWLTEFLDRSKHKDPNVPLETASIHFYASSSNRSNVETYTKDFFGAADKFLVQFDKHVALRDKMSPATKLALTELGILMVDDMALTFGEDGGLPDLFFNAAGAFYTYVFAHLAQKHGVEFACFSQFVGSPPIEKWNINDMQFPSGTMISWETGLGNAKYWALKLLLTHLQSGDIIQKTRVAQPLTVALPAKQVACEAVGPWTFNNEITLSCKDRKARIERIWADMGHPPTGECGAYVPDANCSNHLVTTAWAGLKCLGRHSCTLDRESLTADYFTCPIKTFILKTEQLFMQRFTVQARCTGDMGISTSAEYQGDDVYSLGFTSPKKDVKKLLFVNKQAHALNIRVDAGDIGADGSTAYIVDPKSVQRGSAQGIRTEHWTAGKLVTLQPYAVVMAIVSSNATRPIGEVIV